MSNKKPKVQFRYYAMPEQVYILPLLGEGWVQEYGKGIDYLHYHNHLEIGYCYSGTGEVGFLEFKEKYHEDMFTMIPKNCPHTTNSTPGTASKWEFLYVDTERFAKEVLHLSDRALNEFLGALDLRPMVLTKEECPFCAKHLLELLDCLRTPKPYYHEESNSLLATVLYEILQYESIRENKPVDTVNPDKIIFENRNSSYVAKAISYMEVHYAEKITMEDIAEYCNISQTHLRRVFDEVVKKSLVHYLNELRVEHACKLLDGTDYPIVDIAYECGFVNLSTFNRNFKGIMSVSPSTYRKRPENYAQILKKFQIHNEEGW